MKNEIDFVSLLQDDDFIQRVKETMDNADQLEILEKEYPDQRAALVIAVDFIAFNLGQNKRIESDEAERILKNIQKNIHGQSHRYLRVLKVAVSILIILGCSWFTYLNFKNDPLDNLADLDINKGNESIIILSDGSKHKLEINGSQIEYKPDGKEIVVRNKKEEEKIENATSSKTSINQIIVPYGHKHSLILSDGTKVTLNSGSRLAFPSEFQDDKREVYLCGEGYFEVTKNPGKPFFVKTDNIDIKVLGTVFNISAYKEEKMVSAVLVEGKVTVSEKRNLFSSSEKYLKPGEGFFYCLDNFSSEIRNVDTYEYTSWIDGLLQFKDKSLHNIIGHIEKYYNQKIIIENELSNTLISGKLVLDDGITEAVQYLAKTIEGTVERAEDGTITIKKLTK